MLPTYVLIIIFISMASAITNYKNEMGDIGTHPGRPFEFQHIHGLVAAVYTPFNADGSLNLNQVANQAKLLVKDGVHYVLVAGTTGESLKLTVPERKELAEKWVEIGKQYNITVFIHVGHDSIEDAKDLARHSQQIGAAAIVAMPPSFFKPSNVPQLVQTMSVIAAAAPSLPFFYYHIPSMTNVLFPMLNFLQEVESTGLIPTLVGIKYSHYDIMDFSECIHFKNACSRLFGKDEILTSALVVGCKAAIGSTYNFVGKMMNELIHAYEEGDLPRAQHIQKMEQDLVELYNNYPGQEPGKAIMKMFGVDCGPPRLPTYPLTESQYQNLEQKLKEIGILH